MRKIIFTVFFLLSLLDANSFEKDICTLKQVEDIKVTFEGYKTNFKAGVTAKFDKVKYKVGSNSAENVIELLSGYSVEIDKNSVNAGNSLITKSLLRYFFNKIDGDKISAEILGLKPIYYKTKKGSLDLNITMNGITKKVEMFYYKEGDFIYGEGEIDILDFNASKAFESISKACYNKHLGKTWSDVGIDFMIKVESICKKRGIE